MLRMYVKGLFDDPADGDNGNNNDDGAAAGNNGGNGNQGGNGEKTYTKAEMDAYTNAVVSRKKAEWEKSHKASIQDEAARLAAMNAQERAEHDRDEYKKKYEEQLRINTKATLTAEARRIISDAGVTNVSDDLIERLIGDDAETTKAAVDGFVAAYNAAVQTGITNAARKPSPKAGASGSKVTKETIEAIKDPIERQRMIRKHHKLYGF